ncbi:MAG: hypothetical protein ACRD12_09855 [Acidimicrobiales bacterium]
MDRVLCVRDLLHAAAERQMRLATDVRPLGTSCHIVEPIAGYAHWDPDDLVHVVDAAVDGLVQTAAALCTDDRLPMAVRDGLALIMAEFVCNVLSEAARHLGDGELDVGA